MDLVCPGILLVGAGVGPSNSDEREDVKLYCSVEEQTADFCTPRGNLLRFCKLPKPQRDLLALVGGGWAAVAQPCLTSDLV